MDAQSIIPVFEKDLRELDKDQLCDLLVTLAARDTELCQRIRILVNEKRADSLAEGNQNTQRQRKTLVDPEPYAKEAWRILHSLDDMPASQAYGHVGEVISELGRCEAYPLKPA